MRCPHCGSKIEKPKLSKEQTRKLFDLYDEGLSVREIAKRLDDVISYSTVARYINAYQTLRNMGVVLGKKEEK